MWASITRIVVPIVKRLLLLIFCWWITETGDNSTSGTEGQDGSELFKARACLRCVLDQDLGDGNSSTLNNKDGARDSWDRSYDTRCTFIEDSEQVSLYPGMSRPWDTHSLSSVGAGRHQKCGRSEAVANLYGFLVLGTLWLPHIATILSSWWITVANFHPQRWRIDRFRTSEYLEPICNSY